MMMAFILLLVILSLVLLAKYSRRPAFFPPGPRGLPIVGYAPFVPRNKPVSIVLQDLAKKYGPVTGFYVGPNQSIVSIVGPKAIREALQNEDLNGRPTGAILQARTYGQKLGLITIDGTAWREQRRFTLRQLRDLGFGKTSNENQIVEEIKDLILDIASASETNPNQVVDFGSTFKLSTVNILWAIVGGKRFQRDDVHLKNLVSHIDKFLVNSDVIGAITPIPAWFLRVCPSIMTWLGFNVQLFLPLQKYCEDIIENRLSTKPNNEPANDFIDKYLEELLERARTNQLASFSKKQLTIAIQDLFIAGLETSSSIIGFFIILMINYPEVQKKMQAELDEICGESLPSLAHRPMLHYTDAVLAEVIRSTSIVPVGIPHRALKDTRVMGHFIPKNSIVILNLQSSLHDQEVWEDPENFRPDRHLDQNGKLMKKEAFIPFGLGKRNCLGETLARNTIFLASTALVKTFTFESLPHQPPPTLEPNLGPTFSPKPFKAVVVRRGS